MAPAKFKTDFGVTSPMARPGFTFLRGWALHGGLIHRANFGGLVRRSAACLRAKHVYKDYSVFRHEEIMFVSGPRGRLHEICPGMFTSGSLSSTPRHPCLDSASLTRERVLVGIVGFITTTRGSHLNGGYRSHTQAWRLAGRRDNSPLRLLSAHTLGVRDGTEWNEVVHKSSALIHSISASCCVVSRSIHGSNLLQPTAAVNDVRMNVFRRAGFIS